MIDLSSTDVDRSTFDSGNGPKTLKTLGLKTIGGLSPESIAIFTDALHSVA
jgi:hypothetical protein